MQSIKLKKEPKVEAKLKAFPYQFEAFESIQNKEYSAIFHEQGLGKSKIAIDLMLFWLEKKLIDTVLFIVKKGLVNNWLQEFNNHSYIKPKILGSDKPSNFYVFNSPSRVLLTHYEVMKSEQNRFKIFLKTREVAAILDESTKIKNPDSSITKVMLELAPLFKKRVIMTGTPIANRPYDIWSQIWFLDQGKNLGNDFIKFKNELNFNIALTNDQEKREMFEHELENIFSRIKNFTVRETKRSGIIKLPEKTIHTVVCEWEQEQYNLYRQVQKETRAIVVKDGLPTEDNAEEVLKRMLRLVQIASNPKLIDESYNKTPGKFNDLEQIISGVIHKNEKCIIWTSFIQNVNWLSNEFENYGCCKIHGGLDMSSRHRAAKNFINDESKRILIATPGSAKEGLTLTVANHVVFYDRTFSLDDYLQAQDRIHRISQTRECHVYNLIMKDSIDEWVDILLENKKLAAQLAQKDITLDYYRNRISYDFITLIKKILVIN